MKLKDILNIFGKVKESPDDSRQHLAITAMASLPQWPDFVATFVTRKEQWLEDAKSPTVYLNHAELASVMARVSECDYFITLFQDSTKGLSGSNGP